MIKRVSRKQIRVDEVVVLPRRRQPTGQQVETVRKSLRENGQLSPVGVRIPEHFEVDGQRLDGKAVLVFGATRLAAAQAEGWEHIEAEVIDGTDFDFLKAEIAENLHRGALTVLEQAEQYAAYEKLIQDEARAPAQAKGDAVRAGELSAATGRKKVGHRPKGSISPISRRTAAAELRVDEKALRRAAKVASLSPEAKWAARATGLDENQRALLAAAEETTPDLQVAKVYRLADHQRQGLGTAQRTVTSRPAVGHSADPVDDIANVIIAAWARADMDAKRRVVRIVGAELRAIDQLIFPNDPTVHQGRLHPSTARGARSRRTRSATSEQYELPLAGSHLARCDAKLVAGVN